MTIIRVHRFQIIVQIRISTALLRRACACQRASCSTNDPYRKAGYLWHPSSSSGEIPSYADRRRSSCQRSTLIDNSTVHNKQPTSGSFSQSGSVLTQIGSLLSVPCRASDTVAVVHHHHHAASYIDRYTYTVSHRRARSLMSVGERFSQRSTTRQKGGFASDMTTWGTLTLDENPKMPVGVSGWEDAISPKVPRLITLRGNVSYEASYLSDYLSVCLSYLLPAIACPLLRFAGLVLKKCGRGVVYYNLLILIVLYRTVVMSSRRPNWPSLPLPP